MIATSTTVAPNPNASRPRIVPSAFGRSQGAMRRTPSSARFIAERECGEWALIVPPSR